jgi:hypothetical protein
MYKNGPGRPRKLRIREVGEEGARRRRKGVVYICTKCNKPGHNAGSCKSKIQDPNGLKRKVTYSLSIYLVLIYFDVIVWC